MPKSHNATVGAELAMETRPVSEARTVNTQLQPAGQAADPLVLAESFPAQFGSC